MKTWVVAGVLALGAAACGGGDENVCTEIGCASGVNVQVTSTSTRLLSVTVASAEGTLSEFRCDTEQNCLTFIPDVTPAEITVTVRTSGGTITRTIQPNYIANRPNGPNCPPECRQASVTLQL